MNQTSPSKPDLAPGFNPTTCTRCGHEFGCGVNAATPCWCTSLPALAQIDPVSATCLCPDCLARALAAQSGQ